jgi:hypothetical protein
MSAPTDETIEYVPTGWRRLLVALWSGPHWWATHLGLTYLVVPETCMLGIQWTLHLITVGCLAGAAVGAWVSRGIIRRAVPLRDRDRYALRDGYLGWLGLSMCIFFGAVIVAENLPRWFLDACW